MKYTWKVSETPSGRFRSFQKRAWPTAETDDGSAIGWISCEDDYRPSQVKTGNHKPLTVRVRKKCETPEDIEKFGGFKWMKMVQTFKTLDEAKASFKRFVDSHPVWPFV